MPKFDREIQRTILEVCMESYPSPPPSESFNMTNVVFCLENDEHKLKANIIYLYEHGLIKLNAHPMDNVVYLLSQVTATKDGIDFMLQDDGLNSILNVTTIKFHDDAVKLIADFINKNVESPEDKKKFLHQLRELPYETTKHLSLELVSKGLSQMPNAIQWLQKLLHHS